MTKEERREYAREWRKRNRERIRENAQESARRKAVATIESVQIQEETRVVIKTTDGGTYTIQKH